MVVPTQGPFELDPGELCLFLELLKERHCAVICSESL